MKKPIQIIAITATILAAAMDYSYAQVKVGNSLLIDLHASRGVITNQSGRVLAWRNYGIQGGNFTAFGTDDTIPGISNLTGQACIGFDGGDRLKSVFSAPSEITGAKNDYTIELWVNNPSVSDEECVFTWARRGTDFRAAQINYGSSGSYGAVTHWSTAGDMGWTSVPAANQWHHIAVTYDGATERLYLDGVLHATEAKSLNIWAGDFMAIGSAYESYFGFSKQYSGYIAALRVHSGVLSADDVSTNYAVGVNGSRPIYVHSVTDVTATSAKINGYLGISGSDVTVFYGDVDGGTNAAFWGFYANLGTLNAGEFLAGISDLWDGIKYFCRVQAVKDGVTNWSDSVVTFTVAAPPVIENSSAKTITTVYARLAGNLVSTNYGDTQVKVYVGTADGVDDPAGWEKVYDLGICSTGAVEAKVSNLQPGTKYYYRFYAENPAGGTWATSSSSFTTAPYFERNGYQYFSSFNFSGYTLGETLTNFPALVVLSTAIQGFSYDQFQSGNADLKFTDFNGTELKYEVEKWDTTGSSYVWLRVPEITNNAVIFMFWGKSGVTEPSYRTDHSVWGDGFAGVWHMTNKYCLNAAGINYNIDTLTNESGITDVQGKIGTAQSFVPTSYGTAGDLDLDTNITISAWVWANNLTAEHNFIGKGDSYLLWSTTGGAARWEYRPWGGDIGAALPGANQWFHVAVTWDGIVQKIYVNGTLSTYWTKFAPINKNDNAIAFGNALVNGRPHNGYLDECRVEVVPRSAAWIKASYINQNNPGQFITFGKASWLGAPISFDNLSAGSISADSAVIGATVLSDGAVGVTNWGFVYGTSPAPTTSLVQFSGVTNAPFTFNANINGLSSGTHYYFRAWASNETGGTVYSQDAEFYTEPGPATDITFTGIQNNQMTIAWTQPTDAPGSLVVVREGSAVNAIPTDGIIYNANSAFEQGTDIGGGSFVVYNGSGNQVTVTDLVPGKTYYVAVFTYSGGGALINYLTSTCATASQQTASQAGHIMIAGKLLIDISAEQGVIKDENGYVTEWINNGVVGGSFVQDPTTPNNPLSDVVASQRAISFNGVNHLKSTFTAPREITGLNSQGKPDDYAIEVWIYNPQIAPEEWFFSWGRRGTENRCAAFGYGSQGTWGAIGHWGAGDVAYSGGVPVAGQWHHIVAIYDGVANYIYVDGMLNTVKPNYLNIWDDGPVVLGDQYWDSPFSYANMGFSGSIASLRVHSRAMTAEQVVNNFALGPGLLSGPATVVAHPSSQTVAEFSSVTFSVTVNGEPPINYQWFRNGNIIPSATNRVLTLTNVTVADNGATFYVVCGNNSTPDTAQSDPATLSVYTAAEKLTHRYSFNGDMRDSIGTAHGFLRSGAYLDNGRLVLSGGGQYGELPSGIISGYTALTVEFWMDSGINGNWNRVFDFGDRTTGNQGKTYVFFCSHSGNNDHRVSIAAGSGDNAGGTREEPLVGGAILDNLGIQHIVCVFDPPKGVMRLYRNGVLEAQRGISIQLSEINNVYSWLGRSLYQADSFFNGSLDEFRIYNAALSDGQISLSYSNGPNVEIGYGPVTFVEHPSGQTVVEGYPVTLNAKANGQPPITYQWFKNGELIPDATNRTYTTGKLFGPDNGVQFHCVAYNTVDSQQMSAISETAVIGVVDAGAVLIHRYTFDFEAADSVGIADGTLMGGAVVENGKAYFNGQDAYIQLLPHMVDYLSSVTIEFWGDFGTNNSWPRVFDFGDVNAANQGRNYLFLAPNTHWNGTRLAITDTDPGGTGEVVVDTPAGTSLNNKAVHVACVVDPLNRFMAVYTNGVLAGARYDLNLPLSSVVNNYSFIGKSLYAVDPYLVGAMEEFRIYGAALSPEAIYQNYQQGPQYVSQGGSPVLMVQPQSQTIEYSSNAVLAVVAVGSVPMTYQWYDGTDAIPDATNATLILQNATFAISGHSYSVMVVNNYGEVTTEPVTITVKDTQAPLVESYTESLELVANSECKAELPDLTTNVIAIDASGEVTITQSIQSGTLLDLGETVVVLTISDKNGNSTTRETIVTVVDKTAPIVISFRSSYIQNIPIGGVGIVPDVVSSVVASENCGGVTITQDLQAGSQVQAGTYTIQIEVSDAAGNTTNLTSTLLVNTIPVAEDLHINMTEDQTTAIALLGNDVDGAGFGFIIASLPTNGLLYGYVDSISNCVEITTNMLGTVLVTNVVFYTPNTNFIGTDSFTYSVSDGTTNAQATVTITKETPGVTPEKNHIAIQNMIGGVVSLRFNGDAGKTYKLLRATEIEGPWTIIDTRVAPSNGLIDFGDNNPVPGRAFYRVVTE